MTHMVCDHPFGLETIDKSLHDPRVIKPVYRIPRYQDVHIARRLLTATIGAHDLDPNLRVDGHGLGADELIYLTTLVARYARLKIVIKLDAQLSSVHALLLNL